MQTLKITTLGNSAAVVLPKAVLEHLRASKGDRLFLTETKDGYLITAYDEEVARQLEAAEEVMREDRDVLRALAK